MSSAELNLIQHMCNVYFLVAPQVLIYTDDFKSERRDRERAQGQIQDLKEQVYQLKQQLHKQVRHRPVNEVEDIHVSQGFSISPRVWLVQS